MSFELHFNNHPYQVKPGKSLFEYAESFGIRVPTSCLKNGKCKECMVEVTEGMEYLSRPVVQEEHLRDNFRLSCCTKINSGTGLVRCHTMRRGELVIESHALDLPERVKDFIPEPAVTRNGDRVLLDGEEIDRRPGPLYGIAMDIGTTTVVLRLVNLENGQIAADASFENPQRFGGSDVMARIQYDTDHKGKLLQRTLAGYITHAIEDLPVDPQSVYEVVVAANSTMRDLFFRLNVHSIGQNPYQSITELEMAAGKRTSTSLVDNPKRLQLPVNPKARIYGLPVISGHVGADAAACMLAVDIFREDKQIAIMDIGTNTELILGNKDKIYAASCPAGPAFEGGAITSGMPGLPGAIEKVSINGSGDIKTVVIGGGRPVGICGSGLVDTLSELLKNEQINELGRFENGDNHVVISSAGDEDIIFNESDINELAQAKGANVAGLQIIFKNYGLAFDDLDIFYLAGGFGRHLNIESSKRIGLIPDIDNNKIKQVGNAAIEGATIALLSMTRRQELEDIVKKVVHCRLEADPDFFNYFVEGCQFKSVK
jgi:uncharacterized 2Fe-2S/4Fe-4S cluster protein (DUF4445 family)